MEVVDLSKATVALLVIDVAIERRVEGILVTIGVEELSSFWVDNVAVTTDSSKLVLETGFGNVVAVEINIGRVSNVVGISVV